MTPFCRFAIGTNKTFGESVNENSIWYQQLNLKDFKTFERCQSIVRCLGAVTFRLYVRRKKGMNFQDDIFFHAFNIPNCYFQTPISNSVWFHFNA